MVTKIQEPAVTIRDLLDNNWQSANTSGVKPRISTGWFDQDALYPQISCSAFPEGTLMWGVESGQGSVQVRDGVVNVVTWSHRKMVDSGGSPIGTNPKEFRYEMRQEIERIVVANENSAIDLLEIRFGEVTPDVKTDFPEPVYTDDIQIVYRWIRRP